MIFLSPVFIYLFNCETDFNDAVVFFTLKGRFHLRVRDGALAQLLPLPREKQRKQLGGGAIADGETGAKNASGNGPLIAPGL
jgi:hypothetical protein